MNPKRRGHPPLSDSEPTEKCSIRLPESLKTKVNDKVRELRALGIKTDSSKLHRIIIEKNIDSAERFFSQEIITR